MPAVAGLAASLEECRAAWDSDGADAACATAKECWAGCVSDGVDVVDRDSSLMAEEVPV